MDEYLNYLKALSRNGKRTLYELHQLLLSRLVARHYGLSEKEISDLDVQLEGDKIDY